MKLLEGIWPYRLLYASAWMCLIGGAIWAISNSHWLLLLGSYIWARIVGTLAIHIALHRYFTHRAFETTPFLHRCLLYISVLGGEGSPISWATHHRHHHRHSDTGLDLHSPHQSSLAQMLAWHIWPSNEWMMSKKLRPAIKDLAKDPDVMWVHRNYFRIWLGLVLLSLLIDWAVTVFFVLGAAGWILLHGLLGNTIGHWRLPGSYKTFATADNSFNNQWLAWYFLGEGLHNNHHQSPSRFDQALGPGEFDTAGYIVRKFLAKTRG